MIDVLDIAQKQKPHPLSFASLGDFATRPAGHLPSAYLLAAPNVSLYTLDDAQRQAIFVETPEGLDMTRHPFLYQAQYEHAQRVLAVPYSTLRTLAAAIPTPRTPLVLIHSAGRSGSTLLSKAFQAAEETISLSEPDLYTLAVALRLQDSTRDEELTQLLRDATLLLFKPSFTRHSTLWVVKLRSCGIEIADLLARAFPGAKSLFLSRDLSSWLVSNARAFPPLFSPEAFTQVGAVSRALARVEPLLAAHLADPEVTVSATELLCLIWLSVMHRLAALRRAGVSMVSIRYEEMVARPEQALRTIFAAVGLPAESARTAAGAFDTDSQEGSVLARDAVRGRAPVEISESQWDEVRVLLQRYPLVDADMRDIARIGTPRLPAPGYSAPEV